MKKIVFFTLAISTVLTLTATNSFASTATVIANPGGDLTSSFTLTMRQNAAYIAYYAMNEQQQGTYPLATGELFASKECSNCAWDYKIQYGATSPYTYNGFNVVGADLGNMHYGFVGRAAGFGDTTLKTLAGAYQIYTGTSYIGWYNSYFDDPRDQYWIGYGIDMYNNNSWPSLSSTPDRSLFDLLTESQKKEIEAEVKTASKKIKGSKNK